MISESASVLAKLLEHGGCLGAGVRRHREVLRDALRVLPAAETDNALARIRGLLEGGASFVRTWMTL